MARFAVGYLKGRPQALEERVVMVRKNHPRGGLGALWQMQPRSVADTPDLESPVPPVPEQPLVDPAWSSELPNEDDDALVFNFTPEWVDLLFWDEVTFTPPFHG